MTDLLSRTTARPPTVQPGRQTRPLVVGAALAGVSAAASVLLACMALGLAGWFASEAGSYGTTKDALRVGADGWLLAQGAHLALPSATITVVPLGLSALCAYTAFRLGRWAAATSLAEATSGVLVSALALAGGYAAVVVVAALLASVPSARPNLSLGVVGGLVIALVGGGAGLLSGSGHHRTVWGRLPGGVRAVLSGATAGALLLVAGSAALLGIGLLHHLGTAANVLSLLHITTGGGLLYTVVVAAVAPNAVLLTSAYLVGPGFAVGTGTIVSPTTVVLGPVPAFPLLAALPGNGPTPGWTTALLGLPGLLVFVGVLLVMRRLPTASYLEGLVRGLASGALAGVLAGMLVAVAGGGVGPGRMAHVGAPRLATLGAAIVAMAIGGGVAGVVGTRWGRWRWWEPLPDDPVDGLDDGLDQRVDDEVTVELRLETAAAPLDGTGEPTSGPDR